MNKQWYILVCVLAILSQQSGYILHAIGIKDVWYWFNAFTHFLLWVVLFFNASKTSKTSFQFHVTWYGCFLSLNQLVDELYKSALETNLNEILVATVIIVHLITTLIYERRKG